MKNKYKLYLLFMLLALLPDQYVRAQQQMASTSTLKVKIPFETDNGAIILKVKINGSQRPLRLLFDTGADGMALSQDLADSIGLKVSGKQKASVVGGSMDIAVSEGNVVQLDSFELPDQRIAIFKELPKGTDGIIGNIIARRYVTKVDFDKKELSLYDFEGYEYEEKGTVVPITIPSGLFIIPGTLSIAAGQAHRAEFVFDTGAAYQLICFRPFVKKNRLLVSGFKPEYHGSTSSMGVTTPTFSGKAASFSFSNMPVIKEMPVTLMAGGGQSEDWNPGFDGSIGARLISRYNFTINLKKKEIHLVANKSYDYPHDFAIGGYLFGFDGEGALVIQGLTAMGNPHLKLKQGARLKSLNGLSAQQLLKDRKQLDKLLAMPGGTNYVIESVHNGQVFNDTITKQL